MLITQHRLSLKYATHFSYASIEPPPYF